MDIKSYNILTERMFWENYDTLSSAVVSKKLPNPKLVRNIQLKID